MKFSPRALTTAVFTAVALGLLSGCAGSSASTAAYSYSSDLAAPQAKNGGGIAENMELAAADFGSEERLTSANAIQQTNIDTSRKLIRNANLSVESTEFDALLTGINQLVNELGGYVEQSDISGNSISAYGSGRRYAYLCVRVPAAKLDQFISQVSEQGNITNKSESTQDVTLQYSDLESRKKSLTVEQERLWELLEKADSLDAVIALESRLSEIRYQLESFESQLRLYDNQVDYSSVTLNINEVQVFTPTSPDSVITRIQKGFSKNLSSVCSGLVDLFVWLISSLPTLIILGILVAFIIFISRKLPKSSKAKKKAVSQKLKSSASLDNTSAADTDADSQE